MNAHLHALLKKRQKTLIAANLRHHTRRFGSKPPQESKHFWLHNGLRRRKCCLTIFSTLMKGEPWTKRVETKEELQIWKPRSKWWKKRVRLKRNMTKLQNTNPLRNYPTRLWNCSLRSKLKEWVFRICWCLVVGALMRKKGRLVSLFRQWIGKSNIGHMYKREDTLIEQNNIGKSNNGYPQANEQWQQPTTKVCLENKDLPGAWSPGELFGPLRKHGRTHNWFGSQDQ